jgi:hypothetical protein
MACLINRGIIFVAVHLALIAVVFGTYQPL